MTDTTKAPTEPTKLDEKAFVVKAIHALRREGYKGIHVKFSGFNAAYRQYFQKDPVETDVVKRLTEAGVIEFRPAKQGLMIYLPGEGPKFANSADQALSKILG